MNIPQEVILDLLPAYFSGDASPATRALVDSYLSEHAAFAEQVRRYAVDFSEPGEFGESGESGKLAPLSADVELRTFRRTRSLLAWQRWAFGLGLGFTISAFATVISFGANGVTSAHLLLRDYPQYMVPLLLFGVGCLAAYVAIARRLRTNRPQG